MRDHSKGYCWVLPGHYGKLGQILSEIEEQELINKSESDCASPLVHRLQVA